MEFTVPQFIDEEDKILGPVTVRQFLICLVGVIIIAVEYVIFSFWPFVIIGLLTALPTAVIAFAKVNGRPFHFFIINVLENARRPAIRVWSNELTKSELKHYVNIKVKIDEAEEPVFERPRLTRSRLSQLALIVDTGGSYSGETVLDDRKKTPVKPS